MAQSKPTGGLESLDVGVKVVFGDDTPTIHSNIAAVNQTPWEIVLNFAQLMPAVDESDAMKRLQKTESGKYVLELATLMRVVVPKAVAQGLMDAIAEQLKKGI